MKRYLSILLIAIVVILLVSAVSTDQTAEAVSDEHITALVSLRDYYSPNVYDTEMLLRLEVNEFAQFNMDTLIEAYSPEVESYLISTIINEAINHEVPINILLAIASVESNFTPRAINYNVDSTDYGLFQLNDSYRQHWSKPDFFNIQKNTEEAARYFREMYDELGNYEDAIRAYNAGAYRIIHNRVPESTQMYIIRVLEEEHRFNIVLDNYIHSDLQ